MYAQFHKVVTKKTAVTAAAAGKGTRQPQNLTVKMEREKRF
jgi:hypothetical protein